MAAFRRAERVEPNNPDLHFRIASYRLDWYFEPPEKDRSEGILRQAVRGFRRAGYLSETHSDRAIGKLGRILRAPRLLRWARPETAWGYRGLGEEFLRRGAWREAASELEQYRRRAAGREQPRALLLLGTARARAGEIGRARDAWLEGAVATEEAGGDAGRYMADVFERLERADRLADGIPLWRDLAGRYPGRAEAMRMLVARALVRIGRADDAVPILDELRSGARRAEASFELHLVRRAAGEAFAAGQRIQEAVDSDPGNARYRHHLSLWLESEGRLGEALEQAEEAVRLAPGDALHRNHRDALVRRLGEGGPGGHGGPGAPGGR